MAKEVKIKDRERAIEYIRMALNMCEIGVNYQQAELIVTVVSECDRLRGDLTVEDTYNLLSAHKAKWEKYFNENEQPNTT